MIPNLSIEKAQLLQKILEEIKNILDQEILVHNNNDISITLSVLGNIKEIANPNNENLETLISVINQATTVARQQYEVKQAQLLQKEMQNLM